GDVLTIRDNHNGDPVTGRVGELQVERPILLDVHHRVQPLHAARGLAVRLEPVGMLVSLIDLQPGPERGLEDGGGYLANAAADDRRRRHRAVSLWARDDAEARHESLFL